VLRSRKRAPKDTGLQAAAVQSPRHLRTRSVLGWVATIVVSLIFATGIRAYAAQSFYVPSGSMLPTLQIGDRLIVNKLSSTIHRGDIVVFRRAPGDSDTSYADLVKRVIGLPGETISSRGETILINGKPIAQPWLPALSGICSEQAANISTMTLGAGQYFMMGDCRGDSSDSRAWGTVPASYIIGKVTVVIWRHGHPWIHWF
jgi:signal peptidase I